MLLLGPALRNASHPSKIGVLSLRHSVASTLDRGPLSADIEEGSQHPDLVQSRGCSQGPSLKGNRVLY
jgi:hypothetical protein